MAFRETASLVPSVPWRISYPTDDVSIVTIYLWVVPVVAVVEVLQAVISIWEGG